MQKKIAAVHDISGFGRCSLTTAIAVLSACGHQCCPVPSAVLSAHTAYEGITYRDLTEDLPGYVHSFETLGLHFDAIYSGYLSSGRQIEQVIRLAERCAAESCITLVDPVMGDNGKPYTVAQNASFIDDMRELCRHADVITPNTTEVAMLLGEDPRSFSDDRAGIEKAMRRLAALGPRDIIVTGLRENGRIGAGYFSADTDQSGFCFAGEVPAYFPGTGDLFASVLLGVLLRDGQSLQSSTCRAVDFIHDCAQYTLEQGMPPIDGVQFECLLDRLIKQ